MRRLTFADLKQRKKDDHAIPTTSESVRSAFGSQPAFRQHAKPQRRPQVETMEGRMLLSGTPVPGYTWPGNGAAGEFSSGGGARLTGTVTHLCTIGSRRTASSITRDGAAHRRCLRPKLVNFNTRPGGADRTGRKQRKPYRRSGHALQLRRLRRMEQRRHESGWQRGRMAISSTARPVRPIAWSANGSPQVVQLVPVGSSGGVDTRFSNGAVSL